MFEEGMWFRWENILTVLIGIVIVASIYLVIYRRKRVKQKRLEREAELQKNNKQVNDNESSSSD